MKTRKGWLIQRGRTYHAAWKINGKLFTKSTGQTVHKDAVKELARIMQPFLVEDDVRTLETVKARIEGAKAELAVFDEQANPPVSIMGAWLAYVNTPNRPDTGKATLDQYEIQFGRFQDWLKSTHPQVKALRDVTPDMAGEFVVHLGNEGKSGNTINKYLNLLTLVFRVLKDKARLTVNPWEGIQRKTLVTHGRRELTIEELRRVCAAADGELRLMLALGLYTGLRLGDCATLRWGEVDLIRGRITRIPNKTGRRNPHPVIVPIHASLRAILEETPRSKRHGYVLPESAAIYARRSDTLTDRVQRLFEACEITTHKPGTGFEIQTGEDGKKTKIGTGRRASVEVGFHSLRHSFVSLCRASDVPLSVVESIVGHSNPAMTRHYTHTGDAAALAAVSSLPSLTAEDTKFLPPAQSPRRVDAGAVLAVVAGMTADNWQTKQAELLAMLAG
jgi:integrase